MNPTRRAWWSSLLLAVVLVLGLMSPLSALAAGEYTLTIADQNNGAAIPGAAFRLYKVAEFSDDLRFTVTSDFQNSGVSLAASRTSSTWADRAATLEAFLVQQSAAGKTISPVASGTTDSSGNLVFSNLPRGLYLLVGDQTTVNGTIYTPTPILLTLPCQTSEGRWSHSPTVYAKNSVQTTPAPSLDNLTVVKVWEDDDDEAQQRPQSVTVTLYQGETAYSTVTLSADNNWRHTWTNLSATESYYVTEQDIPDDYTVTSVRNGNSFVVTNLYTTDIPDSPIPEGDEPDIPTLDEPDVPKTDMPNTPTTDTPTTPTTPTKTTTTTTTQKLPQTGQLWWPVTALAIGGLAMILVGWGLSRRGEDNET